MEQALTVKPEVLEVQDLDTTIDYSLQKANVTDAVINALQEKYGGLKLNSLEDKENYLIIKESRREVRKVGIIVENLCKKGREDAVAIQKKWLAKEKEVLKKISAVQDPLDLEIEKFDNEVARKEAEEFKRQEEAYMSRQTTLLKMEAKYIDGCFTLGNVSYETMNIKEAEEEVWNDTILPKYKREFDKIEAVRAEQERIQAEAAEKFRLEQEAFLKQQQEFKEQQAEMARQMAEMQKLKDEQERIARDKERVEQFARDQERNTLQANRLNALFPYNPTGADVDMVTLWALPEMEFNNILAKKKSEFEKQEQERLVWLEEKRLADIEVAKQEAIRQEQERQAELKRKEEAQKIAEEQRKQAELLASNEKTKWNEFIRQIEAVHVFQFQSGQYRSKMMMAAKKIDEIRAL